MNIIKFRQVLEFIYLGLSLNCNNTIEEVINVRIIIHNRTYFSHNNLLISNMLSKRTKVKLYKTFIRPIVSYGAETWTIKAVDEKHLNGLGSSSG